MTNLIDWSVAHGIEIGCGLLALSLFMIVWLIVDLVRNRDDGFQPIGRPTTDVPRERYAAYDPRATRNRVDKTLVQPAHTWYD